MLAALEQLEGFEAPAVEWERTLLPARVANYDPRWLDALCLAGRGRLGPRLAASGLVGRPGAAPRRVIPTNAAPITFFLRESADWLPHALAAQCVEEAVLLRALSAEAMQIRTLLPSAAPASRRSAAHHRAYPQQTQHALWELATAGLAAADGFDQLRAMMDPRRKAADRRAPAFAASPNEARLEPPLAAGLCSCDAPIQARRA